MSSKEGLIMYPVDEITTKLHAEQATSPMVAEREPYFETASFVTHEINCGDDRMEGVTIHWFGGALNPVYNDTIMQEATDPWSVTNSWEDRTEQYLPKLTAAGIKIGVHSDEATECTNHIALDAQLSTIGCGYAELRKQISAGIVGDRDVILSEAVRLRPELFTVAEDLALAGKIFEAHDRLLTRDGFFTSGRQVVLKAIDVGANTAVVTGPHFSKKGIINLRSDSVLNGTTAKSAEVGTYTQDDGFEDEAMHRIHIHENLPYGHDQLRIARLIDTIGTMRALGVEEIEIRR